MTTEMKATRTANEIVPDYASHPGELVAEALEAAGMTQKELAAKTGRPYATINEIVKGRKRITADTAIDLEGALGLKAYIWLRLQADYDLVMAYNARKKKQPA